MAKKSPMIAKNIHLLLGLLMLGLGILGAFLPVMPTTIFLIMAAYFFARSSPKLYSWLINHPRFGPAIQNWQNNRAVSKNGKISAAIGMSLGILVLFLVSKSLVVTLLGTAFILLCAAYVLTRPAA